jgi:hypothetical protein
MFIGTRESEASLCWSHTAAFKEENVELQTQKNFKDHLAQILHFAGEKKMGSGRQNGF